MQAKNLGVVELRVDLAFALRGPLDLHKPCVYIMTGESLRGRGERVVTMLGREIATSWISWLYVLLALSMPLSSNADRVYEAGRQVPPTARPVPEECKATEKSPGPIEALLQKLDSGPSPETYEALGILYGRAGNFKCAIAAFDTALALNPRSTQTRYHLGLALTQNHEASRAADELCAVLREEPNSFSAHNALGLALQDLGHLEDAANEFKAALRINPRFALASYDLSQLLSAEKNYQATIYYLKEGLASSPPAGLAYEMKLALAVAYARIGKYPESIPLFKEVVAAHPDSVELHFDLATSYAHCDDYLPAVKEYKEVLRLDPKHNSAVTGQSSPEFEREGGSTCIHGRLHSTESE